MSGGVDYFTPLRLRRHARPVRGRGGGPRERATSPICCRSARSYVRASAQRRRAVPALAALHRAALALGDARRRRAESRRIDNIVPPRRRLGRRPTSRMIHHMDEGIGRVLAALERTGAAERHAGGLHQRQRRRALLRQLAAGRQARWTCSRAASACPTSCAGPRACRRAATTAQLAITMDWTRDLLEPPASTPHPDYPLDGIDLLRGPEQKHERELYWRMKFREQKAVRSGDWKYLSIEGDEFLFDLARDPRERANIETPRAGAPRRAAEALFGWEASCRRSRRTRTCRWSTARPKWRSLPSGRASPAPCRSTRSRSSS